MLEKPDIDEAALAKCLRYYYASHRPEFLKNVQLTFLPLGADPNAAIYRADTQEGRSYFVKLRKQVWKRRSRMFDSLTLHSILATSAPISYKGGSAMIEYVIAIPGHRYSAPFQDFTVTVAPFIEGHNGFEVPLTDQNRIQLGKTLRHAHGYLHQYVGQTWFPKWVRRMPRETYAPTWRQQVREYQYQAAFGSFDDPISAGLAELLRSKQPIIDTLLGTAERFAADLQSRELPMVLTHGDIHGWNMLISNDGQFYIVDWDTLLRAPKERDLMFIGTGLGGLGHSIEDEIRLFYEGYGPAEIDRAALAYYRCERIVQDIASYCEQIFAVGNEDSEDRAAGLRSLTVQFEPGGVVGYALQSIADVDG